MKISSRLTLRAMALVLAAVFAATFMSAGESSYAAMVESTRVERDDSSSDRGKREIKERKKRRNKEEKVSKESGEKKGKKYKKLRKKEVKAKKERWYKRFRKHDKKSDKAVVTSPSRHRDRIEKRDHEPRTKVEKRRKELYKREVRVKRQRDARRRLLNDRAYVTPYKKNRRHTFDRHTRHRHIRHHGHDYYYQRGSFYRRGPAGYFWVNAPIGAIVWSLGIGYDTLWIGGSWHYYYGGTYYRRVPAGYMVVAPPVASVVTRTSVETAGGTITVLVPTLNVRTQPDRDSPVFYQVHEGERLIVLTTVPGWLYVELPSGEFGWVMTECRGGAAPYACG